METQPSLFVVVKILSDLGYSNTLKKLAKEAKDSKLTAENIPSGVRNFNFNALVAGLTVHVMPPAADVAPVEKAEAIEKVEEPLKMENAEEPIKSEKDDTVEKPTKKTEKPAEKVKAEKPPKEKKAEKAAKSLKREAETDVNKPAEVAVSSDDVTITAIPPTTTTAATPATTTPTKPASKKQKQKRREEKKDESGDIVSVDIPVGRFKRIQDEVWLERIDKEELKENSYTMKNDEFSLKAAQELSQVKGKNFRTEKMKKKRASWKGSGEISTQVNSIKFDDSDSD